MCVYFELPKDYLCLIYIFQGLKQSSIKQLGHKLTFPGITQ